MSKSAIYIDIINDLLEGLRRPCLTVIRGPVGAGKALFLITIVRDWIDRFDKNVAVVLFMLSKDTAIAEAKNSGIDVSGYEQSERLRFFEVDGMVKDENQRLSQIMTYLSSAAEHARDGLLIIYPGDIAFAGLSTNLLIDVIGLFARFMRDYNTKIFVSFTDTKAKDIARARELFELVANYVFELSVEVPEAGPPRRFLTIIKPLRKMGFTHTFEIIFAPGLGLRVSGYGIMPDYIVDIDVEDRVYTGIDWLDKITGGLIRGTAVLFTGVSGTGKTLLLLKMAYNYARMGEKTLFISFEEPPKQLIEALKVLGYDYYEVAGNLWIKNINPRTITLTGLFSEILRYYEHKHSIVVLDGLHALWKEFGNKYHRFLRDIVYFMKAQKKILLMSKILTRGEPVYTWLSSIVDGIIEMRLRRTDNEYERYICIRKLRLHLAEPKCYKYDIIKGIIE